MGMILSNYKDAPPEALEYFGWCIFNVGTPNWRIMQRHKLKILRRRMTGSKK